MLTTMIILALSLSIDALGIGISYGIRKIKIPPAALLIISAMAFFFICISMLLGDVFSNILSVSAAKSLGIAILFFMGGYILFQGVKKQGEKKESKKNGTIFSLLIKSMGITIKIIRTPETCDINKSSAIEPFEAVYLGAALSIDSIGVGVSTAILGMSTFVLPLCVCLFQILFLNAGLVFGNKLARFKLDGRFSPIISGSILIVMAVVRCFI